MQWYVAELVVLQRYSLWDACNVRKRSIRSSKDPHAQVTLPNILSSGKPLISKMLLLLSPGTPLIA